MPTKPEPEDTITVERCYCSTTIAPHRHTFPADPRGSLERERDELRAEVERLREEYDDTLTLVEVWKAREAKARAEVERLRAALSQHHPLQAEELFCHICSKLGQP